MYDIYMTLIIFTTITIGQTYSVICMHITIVLIIFYKKFVIKFVNLQQEEVVHIVRKKLSTD